MSYLTKTHTLPSDPLQIRKAMIEYHTEQTWRFGQLADHSRLVRDKRENRARMDEHHNMLRFWNSTKFE